VGAVVHQTALYDFISTIFLLALLLRLRRKPRYDGFLILVFAVWYGAMRIIEDFLREDVRHFGLTGSQWSSIALLAVCLALLTLYRRTPPIGRWDMLPPTGGPTEPAEPATSAPASLGAPQYSDTEQPTLRPPEPHQEE
jgi:hypothetical protein